MGNLRFHERDVIKRLLSSIDERPVALVDGETARKLGEIARRFGIRDGIYIAKDEKNGKSIVVDAEECLRRLFG